MSRTDNTTPGRRAFGRNLLRWIGVAGGVAAFVAAVWAAAIIAMNMGIDISLA